MPDKSHLVAHGLADPAYATAIGQICLLWNQLEDMLGFILCRYFDHDEDVARAVLAVSGNQSRMDLLSHLVATMEKDKEYAARMNWLIKAFSICRENRNIAAHCAVRVQETKDPSWIEKPSKSAINKIVRYAYSVEDMVRVQDSLLRTLNYSIVVFTAATLNTAIAKNPHLKTPGQWPKPLPKTPSLPSKLTPLGPESRPDELPAPQPSE